MSESNDPPAPPPEDEPGPFPESSLTPPPEPPPPEVPATAWSEAPPEPPAPPAPPPAPPAPPPAAERPWMEPSAPAPEPWSATEAPGAPPSAMPSPGGMMSGDPLAGPPPATGSPFPPGYTSPPPPGAGGQGAPPWSPDQPAPQGFAPGTFVLAGWWRRVGATVIDGLLIGAVAMILMAPLGIGLFSSDGSDSSVVALVLGFIVAALVFAAVALAYAPVMMGKTNGKTVGRMATGIRVVRADGQPMTIGFAAVREVAVKALLIGTVAGSVTFGLASLLDVLWPLWDDENRALHDFVVNTRVVMD